ncbi:ATP-dependent protease La Type II [hydrothermal vent metagenome]|uniref:ATP-dependent protease La Type II n=1 Tax=hydrothermal vent metagenome TaxID=652676 RepID=A0A3B0R7V7_9ZZZZ
MVNMKPLPAGELAWQCDPESFSFTTTDDAADIGEIIGQERALKAIDFGLGIEDGGYNIFVLGVSGTGKNSIVRARLEEKAAEEAVPPDWLYVHNFSSPDTPKALRLPSGKGIELVNDMEDLVVTLRRDIPKVFESKDYESHRDEILDGQQERTKVLFHRLEQAAKEKGFTLKKTSSGVSVVPAKEDGKPLEQKDFDKLTVEERNAFEESSRGLQEKLGDVVREARSIDRKTHDKVDQLDREMVQYVVGPLIGEILEKYKDFEEVVAYLNDVRDSIFRNIATFRPQEEMALPFGIKVAQNEPTFERYEVNLIVNNLAKSGAPVVFEPNPTYHNLFGSIEHKVSYGVASTDFTMIKGGAIHKANGGYLVVNALDVLKNVFVYDSLKRLIKNKELRIEDVWEQYRAVSTVTLKPEPIPIDLKIVLIGEPMLYYILHNYDREYRKLFKVKADFDSDMDRTPEAIERYAQFVVARCRHKKLLPFDKGAVARVVEYACRYSGDKKKLTANFAYVESLVTEASYWAGKGREATVVSGDDVERAWDERIYRSSKIEELLREMIVDDTIMISTKDRVAGQLNGLAVLNPGDYAFGKPSKITASVSMGAKGVVGIEREVKMSGRIHNKSQFILKSLLGARYATDFPLSFSATICFEQLYDEIDGDSATCAEFYALLSALSGKELSQGIAVTGSMNQCGEVQPIGGVNEKIEGFFKVCKAKGFTGGQGVIIPRRNVRNLMLSREVRDAAEAGDFAIYPIDMVDEGLEILSGCPVGERGKNGKFAKGTVNFLVEKRLRELATKFKAFGKAKPAKKTHKKVVPKKSEK